MNTECPEFIGLLIMGFCTLWIRLVLNTARSGITSARYGSLVMRRTRANMPGISRPSGLGSSARQRAVPVAGSIRVSADSTLLGCGKPFSSLSAKSSGIPTSFSRRAGSRRRLRSVRSSTSKATTIGSTESIVANGFVESIRLPRAFRGRPILPSIGAVIRVEVRLTWATFNPCSAAVNPASASVFCDSNRCRSLDNGGLASFKSTVVRLTRSCANRTSASRLSTSARKGAGSSSNSGSPFLTIARSVKLILARLPAILEPHLRRFCQAASRCPMKSW